MPNATLNTSTVEGLSGTPAQPITPAVITNGIRLGMREQINILADLNKYSMQSEMSKNAQAILSFNPLIIKLLPSKKVILVPVNCTLNWLLSNNWPALSLIPFKTMGNCLVPISAIFTLIRVVCLELSMKEDNIFEKLFFLPLSLLLGRKYSPTKAPSKLLGNR